MDGFLKIGVFFDSFEINLFHRYFLFCCVLKSFENFTEGSFSQTFLGEIAILPYGFDCPLLHFETRFEYLK